ncbi:M13-type metalloendopeptidase [Pigmentiphaga soli]|uniref:M13-type metalloendopeptidase n=1 Tax=Pigmentiphaga soli TaxID=1007095 RepID=UPI003CD08DBA
MPAIRRRRTWLVVFPAAILQPPLFQTGADPALNYGAIAAVIGHEITHGFDTQGSQFDGDGNRMQWWTPADRDTFEARAARLAVQVERYEPAPGRPDLKLDGRFTLAENIADLGGLNVAYDALRRALDHGGNPGPIDGYTQDQRFFLAWARSWRTKMRPQRQEQLLAIDPHLPGPLRAIVAPSNMAAFGQVFSCRPGDAMVRPPDDRVEIW